MGGGGCIKLILIFISAVAGFINVEFWNFQFFFPNFQTLSEKFQYGGFFRKKYTRLKNEQGPNCRGPIGEFITNLGYWATQALTVELSVELSITKVHSLEVEASDDG